MHDCLDVSHKPFYKRQKKIIATTVGASFRTPNCVQPSWRLNYGGVVITSITGYFLFSHC